MVARVHLVVDPTILPNRPELIRAVGAALDAGVDAVHVRGPELGAAELFELGKALAPLARGRADLVVNDRVDVALALVADGVQLGQRSLPPAAVRRIAPSLAIGASVHSVEEAIRARDDGADWLLLGTIFASRSHPGRPGAGTGLIADVRARVDLPIVAIGGIDADRVDAIVAAGGDGVAVISTILAAPKPDDAAARLVDRVRRALDRRLTIPGTGNVRP